MLNSFQIGSLLNLKGIGPTKILELASFLSEQKIILEHIEDLPEIIHDSNIVKLKGGLKILAGITKKEYTQAREKQVRCEEICRNKGINIIGFYDDEFPETLCNVTNEDGKNAPCVILYCRGNLSVLKVPGVAFIGTREPDEDGVKAGKYFSRKLAELGYNIISGLAKGCDSLGHMGALEVKGVTTAFLGSGVNNIYPRENINLANEIIHFGGLVVSEYKPDEETTPYHLVARDRLQAALANACVVIETGQEGGTWHAVNASLSAKKPVYAVKFKNMSGEKKKGNFLLLQREGVFELTSKSDLSNVINKQFATKRINYKINTVNNVKENCIIEQCISKVQIHEVAKNDISLHQNSKLVKCKITLPGVNRENLSFRAAIFDLDMTLVDSSIAKDNRKKRKWDLVYEQISSFNLYEGILNVLNYLSEVGVLIGLVTSTPRPYAERVINYFSLPIEPKNIVAWHDTKNHKPFPDPILLCISKFQVNPYEVMCFGDTPEDVLAAKKADTLSIGCEWGGENKFDLVNYGADLVYDSPIKLLNDFYANRIEEKI